MTAASSCHAGCWECGAEMRGQDAEGAEVTQKSQKKYQKYYLGVFSVFCGVFAFFAFGSSFVGWLRLQAVTHAAQRLRVDCRMERECGGRTQRTQKLRRGRRKIAKKVGGLGVASAPPHRHFRAGGNPCPPTRRALIPACAGMTGAGRDVGCLADAPIRKNAKNACKQCLCGLQGVFGLKGA